MPERKLVDKDQALTFKSDNGATYQLKVTNEGSLYFDLISGASSTDAVAMWKASEYSGSGQLLKDLSGNGHHLKFGSSHPAYVTNGYLVLPGQSGNYASTPDSAAVSITGDIDIRAKITPTDWTPSYHWGIVGKWSAYYFKLTATGVLQLAFTTGGNQYYPTSTASIAAVDGSSKWVRVTRSSASGNVTFYTSDDGLTWGQLGNTVSGTAGAIADTADQIRIGETGTSSEWFSGRIHFAEIRNGIDGPVVAKFDPSSQVDMTTGWTASTGEVWTINSAAATDGSDPLYLPYTGTKHVYLPGAFTDYLSVADQPALNITSDIDLRVQASISAITGAADRILMAKNYGNSWWWLFTPSGNLYFAMRDAGNVVALNSLWTIPAEMLNTPLWFRMTRNKSTAVVTFYTSVDGTNWTARGSSAAVGAPGSTPPIDTAPIVIGGALDAKIYKAQMYSTLHGSNKVLDIDINDTTATGVSSTKYTLTAGMVSSTGGIVIQNAGNMINDTTGQQSFHTDSSTAGASLVFSLGTSVAMRKVQIYSSGGTHPGIWRIDYSDDGTNWTNIPDVTFGPWTAAGYKGTTWANVGAHNYWRVRLIAATGGAAWLDNVDWFADTGVLDIPRASSPTFTAKEGHIVTINRSTSGRKSALVDRPLFLFGADDFMEAVDNDQLDIGIGDSLTVVAAFKSYGTVGFQRIVSKSNSNPGWELLWRSSTRKAGVIVGDSSFNRESISGTNETDGLHILTGRLRRSDSTIATFVDGALRWSDTTNVSTLGNASNSLALRIGTSAGSTSNVADMEFIGAAIWKRALTDEEIGYLAGEFGV